MPDGWPSIIVEAGFVPTSPGLAGTELILDDATFGKLDTGTLAAGTTWTSLGGYMPNGEPIVQSITITRSSTRQQGPLTTYEAGTCTIVLANSDARFSPENLAGPYIAAGLTQVRPMVPIRVRATWNAVNYPLFSGYARSWTPPTAQLGADYDITVIEAQDAFCVLTGINLPGIAPAGAGELSGDRVKRILGAAGWYAHAQNLDVIGPGQSTMQATTFSASALSLLQLTADSEIADLYINGAGQLVYRDRHTPFADPRSATVQAVFGDNPGTVHAAGTELAYHEITRPDDDVTMANDIQAQIDGSVNVQQAKDAASISRFLFARSYVRSDLILQTDTDALLWANYVLAIARNDESRFDSLTISATADPGSLFPQVLGRDMCDRIQVWRRPPGMGTLNAHPYFAGGSSAGWSGYQGTLSVTGSPPAGAPYPYAALFTITTPAVGAAAEESAGDAFTVTPGASYKVTAWAYTATGTVTIGYDWLDSGGAYLSTSTQTLTIPASTWTEVTTTQAAPGGAAKAYPRIAPADGAGNTIYIQAVIVAGTIVKDCFIRSIEHTITVDGWVTVWGLQDATRYSFLTLDNATLGQLNENALSW